MSWRPARFTIDGLDGLFEGYTDGRRWNGWACPVFARDEADRIAKAFRAQPGPDGPFEARYAADSDAFIFCDPADDPQDEPLAFHSRRVETADGPLTLYFVGTSYWTWDEASLD